MPTRRGTRARSAASRRQMTQQLRALAHPLRLRLVEAFAQGPRTTMQVSADLGEPPTRLYHHVNALQRAGILKLVETRPVRGTTEKYFQLVQKQLGLADPRRLTASSRASLGTMTTAVFEEARRELLAALARPASLTTATAPTALRMVLRLSPTQVPVVRRRLMAALKEIRAESRRHKKGSAKSVQWALTLALAPTTLREKPKKKSQDEV
jgi:DNA-binding transcriptional ArsR family regulator